MKILKTKEEIQNKVKEIAKNINKDFYNKKFTIIIVLKGAFIFASDLVRELNGDFDIEFLRLKSYENKNSSGKVKKDYSDLERFRNKKVLVVEDIVDTGLSMTELKKDLEVVNAKVNICSLIKKKTSLINDYYGFVLGEEFVVGYGLDFNEKFRNLPDLRII